MTNGGKYRALSYCAEIRTGQTFKDSLSKYRPGNLSVLLPKDISEGELISPPIKIDDQQVASLYNHKLIDGEILIANKGTKLGTFLYQGNPTPAIATSSFFVITPNSAILLSSYLNWLLNQLPARTYFIQHASGSTIPSITKSVLSNFQVPIIPIEEQQHIVDLIREFELEQNLLKELAHKRDQFASSYIWERINNVKLL